MDHHGNVASPGRVNISALVAAAIGLCSPSFLCANESAGKTGKSPVEIVSVKKIWNEGKHNAFTDLIRFQGQWYCTFREARGHVKGDGALRIIISDDGETWKSAALLTEEGIDLRDPKISIMPDGRLMIVAGGSVYRQGKFISRQPRVAFSKDGHKWTPTQRILSQGEWLWRVTWHEGQAYGVSYNPELWRTQKKSVQSF